MHADAFRRPAPAWPAPSPAPAPASAHSGFASPSAGIALLADAIELPIGRWDRDCRLITCNEPYFRWAGRPREALIGRTLADIFGDTAWAAARNAFAGGLSGRHTCYERRLTHLGASARWARIQVFPDRSADGTIGGIYTIAFDIHDDVMRKEAASAARRRLQRFTDNIPCPLTYVDKHGVLRFVNRAYLAAAGQPKEQLLGRRIVEIHGAQQWAGHSPHFEQALAGEPAQYTRLANSYLGAPRWMRTSYEPDFDDDGHVAGVYTLTIDVHDLTVAQERLRRSVARDALTDALSRRTIMDRIDAAVTLADQQPVALYFVDLDGFKAVNDALGHTRGDQLLQSAARALQQAVRAEDAVGRFGGDEFLVLAPVHDPAGALVLGEHLLAALRNALNGDSANAAVTASIGYALAPQDATQPMRLLQLADDAMYAAKRSGKNQVMRGSETATGV
ncbi:MAG: diguanylate cyclase [Burkholderiaceae bacterium]|jgi:diguanylate cyclase (GGDEF)-like protein/PAS domain S-box-containing protein|nr:diguanylate cyclase [Aquabacterium sp.]NUP85865.1 diguanylate cyclase [Burkholderiaceae bacterium]